MQGCTTANYMPIIQTVTQAMAELRRKTPAIITVFTAGALEQGRNGWTHQRPEIENYMAAIMRNGNFCALFPCDANMIQAAYEWATNSFNKCIAIVASKSAWPTRRDLMCWRRGETTATPQQIIAFNGLSSDDIVARVNRLAGA